MQHQAKRYSIATSTITYVQRSGGLARLLQQRFDQLERHAYVTKAADYTIIAENGPRLSGDYTAVNARLWKCYV